MTNQKKRPSLLAWLLGIPLLGLLMLEQPDFSGTGLLLWGMFVILMAFTLNMGLAFSEGEISAAYSVGIMSYLTMAVSEENGRLWFLPNGTVLALWSVALGSLVGIWIRQAIRHHWHGWGVIWRSAWEPSFRTAGQLTIGLFTGAFIYKILGGRLPLDTFTASDSLPIAGLIASYLAFYFTITIIKMRVQGSDFEETMLINWQSLGVILLAPLPIAILAPVLYHSVSTFSFALLGFSMLMVVLGTYGFSVTQYRYEQKVRELSSLTAMNSAMQRNLDLQALLQTIYLQVANLLNINNFVFVTQDPTTQRLQYILNIQQGVRNTAADSRPTQGLIEYVLEKKAPLLITKNVGDTAIQMGRSIREKDIRSWLGVSLVTSDRVKGAIVVYVTNTDRQLNRTDQRLLTTIAIQASIAIDNAQLYAQSQNRVHQLRALTESSTQLSRTLNFQEVLQSVCQLAQKVAVADAAAFYMWADEASDVPQLAASTGLSELFTAKAPLPLVCQEVNFKSRQQPIVINDIHEDKRTESIRRLMDKEEKRAWVEVLVKDAEDVLGILVVYYNDARMQTDEENEVLRTFASQAALSILNAQRYGKTDAALTRRMEQMYSLQQLSYDLFGGRVHLQDIYERVLRRAMEGTQSDAAHLSLQLDAKQAPYCAASIGFDDDQKTSITPMVQVTRHVFKVGDQEQVRAVLEDKKYHPLRPETRSYLSVPILRDLEIIGVITLESNTPENFAPNDKYFVMQVGAQAKAALDNYNLLHNIETTRDRLQVILDSMIEGVLLINAEGLVRLANPRIKALLNLEPERITNRHILELLEEYDLHFAQKLGFESEQLRYQVRQLIQGTWKLTERYSSFDFEKDGKKRFMNRFDIEIRRHEQGETAIGWLMVFRDMTEEKELAQARDDLSSMIIHDLRSPLTAINASLKLIDTVVGDHDKIGQAVHQTVETAGRATRKLLHLVNALLDVSKMESGTMILKRELSDTYQITESVTQELLPLAQEMEVVLRNEVNGKLPPVNVDKEKIERVLLNLMDNAIKFTPSEGQVVIYADVEPSVNGSYPSYLRVMVQDNGPGIPDEYKNRLFDRYVQVEGRSGRRRGTGLGLTFCRLTVEAHGGKIWVEDNPQGGSIFTFTLPLREGGQN